MPGSLQLGGGETGHGGSRGTHNSLAWKSRLVLEKVASFRDPLPPPEAPWGPLSLPSIPSVPSPVSREVLQGPPERECCLALFQVDLTF